MLHNEPLLIKTGDSERWKSCTHRGGNFLVDKNNVPFPPFNRGTEGVLNPLMVHFAAALRFRRLDPDRVGGLDEGAKRALKATEELQSAILWIPEKVGRSASVVEKSRVSVAQNHSALPTSASTTKTVERGTHPSLFELLHADNDEVRATAMERILLRASFLKFHEHTTHLLGAGFLPLPDLEQGETPRRSNSRTPSFASKFESWQAGIAEGDT
ncbi:hypothetical protein BDV98DRAFT_561960 [Pterulicium gracile]|uniref:Uncharacterized protein n=1 Tax=Pterulicium gracile TaxID=1884261 RepID=A0A5C3QVH5_9AGAR|nr:hypothetical protein BDV98DRAFT_561960 [Pterula gracilis]